MSLMTGDSPMFFTDQRAREVAGLTADGQTRTCGQAVDDFLRGHPIDSDALNAINDGEGPREIAAIFGVEDPEEIVLLARLRLRNRKMGQPF